MTESDERTDFYQIRGEATWLWGRAGGGGGGGGYETES